jgi:adenylyl-sulfate kinase
MQNTSPPVIWFYGLSGAGKTTLASKLTDVLINQGLFVKHLDGDHLREGLNNNLGFTQEDRAENLRRSAEVAKLFMQSGFVTICSFITPLESNRKAIKSLIGHSNIIMIYVKASLETCRLRDPKGLYKKVDKNAVKNFTGVDSLFEIPYCPEYVIDTEELNVDSCVYKILNIVHANKCKTIDSN